MVGEFVIEAVGPLVLLENFPDLLRGSLSLHFVNGSLSVTQGDFLIGAKWSQVQRLHVSNGLAVWIRNQTLCWAYLGTAGWTLECRFLECQILSFPGVSPSRSSVRARTERGLLGRHVVGATLITMKADFSTPDGDAIDKNNVQVHPALMALTSNERLDTVTGARTGAEVEAWGPLNRRYEPGAARRSRGLLREVAECRKEQPATQCGKARAAGPPGLRQTRPHWNQAHAEPGRQDGVVEQRHGWHGTFELCFSFRTSTCTHSCCWEAF